MEAMLVESRIVVGTLELIGYNDVWLLVELNTIVEEADSTIELELEIWWSKPLFIPIGWLISDYLMK